MNLPSKIHFADESVKLAFESLNDDFIFKSLNKAFEDIEKNAFCGIQVPKRLIPKYYIDNYKIKNLWKYNLPCSWRLLYSIESDGIIVVSLILEWLSHKRYEQRFSY